MIYSCSIFAQSNELCKRKLSSGTISLKMLVGDLQKKEKKEQPSTINANLSAIVEIFNIGLAFALRHWEMVVIW